MSAKMASRNCSSAPIIALARSAWIDGYQTIARHARACPGHPRLSGIAAIKTWMAGTSPAMTTERVKFAEEKSALRRFQSPEHQRQQRVDPGRRIRIVPFVGMGRMMEAAGGVENGAGGNLGVGDFEDA